MKTTAIVDTNSLKKVISSICRAHAINHDASPEAGDLVLVGGSAMMLHSLRPSSGDIDLYACKRTIFETIRRVKKESGLVIDATNSPWLWGSICVGDIAEEPCHLQVEYGLIRYLSLETLYILKSDTGRQKDIDDLALIAPHTTAAKVARRLWSLADYNPGDFLDRAINVISEMQVNFGLLQESWLDEWNGEEREVILETFQRDPTFSL